MRAVYTCGSGVPGSGFQGGFPVPGSGLGSGFDFGSRVPGFGDVQIGTWNGARGTTAPRDAKQARIIAHLQGALQ